MAAKRILWSKETINKNHLLNIIHHQGVRAIPLPGSPRRPLKNVTAQISLFAQRLNFTVNSGIIQSFARGWNFLKVGFNQINGIDDVITVLGDGGSS